MRCASVFVALGLLAAAPARAALSSGAAAPDFSAPATLAGNEFSFHLAEALKKGPVVLYFYPAAFTSGCTEEAHQFAEATAQFAGLGATVIGVSQDKIDVLKKFAVTECRNKFAVAADKDGKISRAYDAVLVGFLGYSNRTSYVIAPDGHVLYSYTAMAADGHVENTMAAVKLWKAAH